MSNNQEISHASTEAINAADQAGQSKKRRATYCTSRRVRSGKRVRWDEAAISTLLQKFAPRYVNLKGTLRTADWTEVANGVNALHFPDNPIDHYVCRDKMDTIKQRYDRETAKQADGTTVEPGAGWSLYWTVHRIYQSGPPSRHAKVSSLCKRPQQHSARSEAGQADRPLVTGCSMSTTDSVSDHSEKEYVAESMDNVSMGTTAEEDMQGGADDDCIISADQATFMTTAAAEVERSEQGCCCSAMMRGQLDDVVPASAGGAAALPSKSWPNDSEYDQKRQVQLLRRAQDLVQAHIQKHSARAVAERRRRQDLLQYQQSRDGLVTLHTGRGNL
ncbi:hypothetical protein L7F22_041514 [Adiantum nelumboides]|nr:hypothetical protein [Adiantum nelumboides]